MKKLMWAISVFALVLTAVVLQFMPDSVPMHDDLAGNIDRWGSKCEKLLFPAIILFLSLHGKTSERPDREYCFFQKGSSQNRSTALQ